MSDPIDLRARAAELEQRVPPIHAGPRTDEERMWLEKAAALRAEADRAEGDVFAGHFEHCYIREGQHCSCGYQPPAADLSGEK
ncbi:hypothetical protein AB0D74_48185 [Streptomyces sp. NPDC048278]|uniref:hypothetical protein n=1 Tax=Streptomyces sp. NPDC048278 TaxID=3155809 RepID=UPI00343FE4CB